MEGETRNDDGDIPTRFLGDDGVVSPQAPRDVLLSEIRPVWGYTHVVGHLGDVATGTVRKWAKTGRYGIPVTKVGGRNRFRPCDIVRWVESRTETAAT